MWQGQRADSHLQEIIAARNIRTAAVEMRNAMQTAEASQRGYLLKGNEIYLASYGTSKVMAGRRPGELAPMVKDRPDQFRGIDGKPEAVAEIKSGTSPYKTTVSLNSPDFADAMGQHAADWLEGKSIPKAMDTLPSVITSDNIESCESDLKNLAAVYAKDKRRAFYLKIFGNTCYTERNEYVNFPWSSGMK